MKILIVEDDFSSRVIMQEFLRELGVVHIAVDGQEAIKAVNMAFEEHDPYKLICLDILMPDMDGQQALVKIRAIEESNGLNFSNGAKIIMTTGLSDIRNKIAAYKGLCNGYLDKPINKEKLFKELHELDLI